MSERLRLLGVADDLTDASDTSVTFADRGYRTSLIMAAQVVPQVSPDEVEVLAVSTDSRAAREAARVRTAEMVREGVESGFDWLYLKVDSTMRGSVQQQVRGTLDAIGQDAIAIICPAYPTMGCTITGGVPLVDGLAVHQTASGTDPVCPVASPLMTDLLPGAVAVSNPGNTDDMARLIMQAGSNQVVVDAAAQNHLDVIAQAAEQPDSAQITLIGSAGLARSWSELMLAPSGQQEEEPLPVSERPLVVATSVHDTSQRQVDAFIGSDAGVSPIMFSPHPAQLLSSNARESLRAPRRRTAEFPAHGHRVRVRRAPSSHRKADHQVRDDDCCERFTAGS